ncbi:MAG: hypothetical protein ABIP93_13195 [Gemmatimonadaceae bacterium]
MGAVAVILLMKERQLIETFRRAGAVNAARGVVPEDIGVDTMGHDWRRIREHVVVRESSPGSGRFYLDEEVWEERRRMRRRILFIVVLALVLGLAMLSGVIATSKSP